MKSKEYNKSLILSQAEELKESIYIIFSPIFFGLYIIFRAPYKAFAPSGREGIAGMREEYCSAVYEEACRRHSSKRRSSLRFAWAWISMRTFCLFSLLFSCIQTKNRHQTTKIL